LQFNAGFEDAKQQREHEMEKLRAQQAFELRKLELQLEIEKIKSTKL